MKLFAARATRVLCLCVTFIAASAAARADIACETKIKATGQLSMPGDEKVACMDNPSPAMVDCMVELLTKGKGKLRNQDFVEVAGLCRVDPSKEVRDCAVGKLDKAWNDPGYRGMKVIGDECLKSRKRYQVKYLGKPLKVAPKKFGRFKPLKDVGEAEVPQQAPQQAAQPTKAQ